MYQSTHIGDCEFWLEDGTLRLYSHRLGQPTGFTTHMSSEETMRLLEWLSKNHEEISRSVHVQAKQVKEDHHYSYS